MIQIRSVRVLSQDLGQTDLVIMNRIQLQERDIDLHQNQETEK